MKSRNGSVNNRVRMALEALEERWTPTTFTVINDADTGAGSLRQAILDANANKNSGGPDRIHFNIPGSGVHTILPDLKLPDITDPVVVDGYTQPGSKANTLAVGSNAVLLIEINGDIAGENNGIVVNTSDTTIRGLVVNGFQAGATTGRGIVVRGVNNADNVIVGNFLGLNPAGTAAVPNERDGIFVIEAKNTRIGGPAPADRNVSSGNKAEGLFVNAPNTVIQNNYFGTNAAGTAAIENLFDGVFLAADTAYTLGGAAAGEGNVIAGNRFTGLVLNFVDNSVIKGNKIGVAADGVTPLGNGNEGIMIINLAGPNTNNLIGGPSAAEANTIAFNGKNGILVVDKTAVGNRFQGNSVFENGSLGIDLDNNGVTANDATDADTGANNLQNTPVLTKVDTLAATTQIAGKLTSVANTQFRIELFSSAAADPSGFGEGQTFLGFVDVTTSKTGVASFVFDHSAALAGGTPVTATATRLDTGDTSEFSKVLGAAVPNIKPNSYVYQDQDGDTVTISFSKPILNGQTIDNVLKFTAGKAIDFATIKRQLQTIDLTKLADPQLAKGTTISFTATRSAANGGDGFANVGHINANGIDLGAVTVDGDLGRITAGDATQTTPGLASLKAQSMGRFGTTTQSGGDLISRVFGKAGAVSIFSDVVGAEFEADGFGSILVGGSLIGGGAANTGRFDSNLAVGSITIRGNIVGAGGVASGSVHVAGTVGTVNVGGSILGTGTASTGQLDFDNTVNSINIGRNLLGGGGTNSGTLFLLDVGNLVIGGSVIGGTGQGSGQINPNKLSNARILGDLIGGTGFESGIVVADSIGTLTVAGDMRSGTGNFSGSIFAVKRISNITVNGSLVGNSSDPVFIVARGENSPAGSTDVVLGGVNVRGSVSFAKIIAGLDKDLNSVNADAQIGAVTVGLDWLASSIVAGVKSTNAFFGDADDVKASGAGVKDDLNVSSRIAGLTIGGQALGTATANGDSFGILAESIGAVRIGGTPLVLGLGNSNDDFFVGVTGDLKLREI